MSFILKNQQETCLLIPKLYCPLKKNTIYLMTNLLFLKIFETSYINSIVIVNRFVG